MADAHTVDEVVSVFIRAGEGLASAHRAGLVHRDFKPENVMLDARGRPRVMDFGLARSRDEAPEPSLASARLDSASHALATPLTQTGAVLGTPAYMAPEQHLGLAADARSDQFSFCVALYEALYGVRPFKGDTVAQIGLAVTSGDIIDAPRERNVPAWLKAILHRGLSVAGKERYESMEELLAALRFDPGLRRRRFGMVAGLLAVAALTTALAFGTNRAEAPCRGAAPKMAEVWSPEAASGVRSAFERSSRSYASSTADHVIDSIDGFAGQWKQIHREVCEATHVRKERSVELMDRQMLCLEQSRTALRELVSVMREADAKVVDEAVTATDGLPELAACADIEEISKGVLPPSTQTAPRVAQLRDELAVVRAQRSTGHAERALELLGKISGALAGVEYTPLSAEVALEEAKAHLDAGHYPESASAFERAYELAVEVGYESVAAEAASELIYVAGYRLARHQAAATWVVNARAWAKRLDAEGPVRAHMLHNYGVLLDSEGRDEEAEPIYREALEIRRKSYGEAHPLVAKSTHNLGNIYLSRGDYDEAVAHYARARDIYAAALGAGHPVVAGTLNNMGLAYRRARRFDEAAKQLRAANEINEATLGSQHPDLAQSLDNLATSLVQVGELEEARVLAQRALDIRLKSIGSEHPDVGDTRCTLADLALAEGKFDEGEEQASAALAVYEDRLGPKHPQVGIALTIRGQLRLGAGRPVEAIPDLERALHIRTNIQAPADDRAVVLDALARSHAAAGHELEALRHREAALEAYAKSGPRYAELATKLQQAF
jgi:tetratricopeptide (TPR) repeat protein